MNYSNRIQWYPTTYDTLFQHNESASSAFVAQDLSVADISISMNDQTTDELRDIDDSHVPKDADDSDVYV